jgi:hypothetical protein
MSDTSRTPGEYPDEETPGGRDTHMHDRRDVGEYTDEETPDGRDTHRSGDVVEGQYEDVEQPDGTRSPAHTAGEGEYTDTDFSGDR